MGNDYKKNPKNAGTHTALRYTFRRRLAPPSPIRHVKQMQNDLPREIFRLPGLFCRGPSPTPPPGHLSSFHL